MKTEEEIKEMLIFAESFYDSSFFDEKYVRGMTDALEFVLLSEGAFPDLQLHKLRKIMKSRVSD